MDVDDSSSQGNRSKTLVAKCVATFFLCQASGGGGASSVVFQLLFAAFVEYAKV